MSPQANCFQRNHPCFGTTDPFLQYWIFFSANLSLPPVLDQGQNGSVNVQMLQVTPLMAAVPIGKPFWAPLNDLAQLPLTMCDYFGTSKGSLMKTLTHANKEANIVDHFGRCYGPTFKVQMLLATEASSGEQTHKFWRVQGSERASSSFSGHWFSSVSVYQNYPQDLLRLNSTWAPPQGFGFTRLNYGNSYWSTNTQYAVFGGQSWRELVQIKSGDVDGTPTPDPRRHREQLWGVRI